MQRKTKKCACGNEFAQSNSFHRACSPKCAIIYAKKKERAKIEKQNRKDLLEFRKKNMSISDLIKIAQSAVNGYIRVRDFGKPCICCQLPMEWNKSNKVDAGHYRSRGAAGHLRFNTFNIHAQRKDCNKFGETNYRRYLVEKIGLDRVERLENNNETVQFKREYLQRIAKIFRRRQRHLRKLRKMV
jgi:hypothetical protein